MIRSILPMLLPLLLPVLLAGCSAEQGDFAEESGTQAAAVEADPTDGIDWFEGSVDEALAAAAETGKPIYLYWGAEWCPPCHAISATVFNSPEFIERSKLFIPVYLDGDYEHAQAAGERFGVMGYPTMIVLNARGEELTRIPNGIDIQAYANILDLTLSNDSSTAELTAAIMADDIQLSKSDCALLAYNSWGQDTRILVEHEPTFAFRRMYAACPEGMTTERSILYMHWLSAALDAADADEEPRLLTDAERAAALATVESLLADQNLVRANIFSVLFEGARITAALTKTGSAERAALAQQYLAAYAALRADEAVYKRERIYTLAGKMNFERIDDEEAELSEALYREIRETVVWADESTPSVYERQPIINALAGVLTEAGMDEAARSLLLAELDRSKQAYYFMPDIADIEQRAGNYEVAIEWLKKGYDESRGPATRFQWGYYYLAGLLEMAPEDVELIQTTTVGMIEDLQRSGGFFQRPKSQLRRMADELIAWGDANGKQAALDEIREAVLAVCAQSESPDESCTTFLERA